MAKSGLDEGKYAVTLGRKYQWCQRYFCIVFFLSSFINRLNCCVFYSFPLPAALTTAQLSPEAFTYFCTNASHFFRCVVIPFR